MPIVKLFEDYDNPIQEAAKLFYDTFDIKVNSTHYSYDYQIYVTKKELLNVQKKVSYSGHLLVDDLEELLNNDTSVSKFSFFTCALAKIGIFRVCSRSY